MANTPVNARLVAKNKLFGVLSTHSHSMTGYPFGSLVQYCLDDEGDVIMYLSDIAQHTRNIRNDSKVSLTIVEENYHDIQNSARVTILGLVEICPDNDPAIDMYASFFPESLNYKQVHGFSFYRLSTERVRYIGGFGDIHWIKREEFNLLQTFDDDTTKAVIRHMNSDHMEAMQKYLSVDESKASIKMLHFDQEGMWLRADNQTSYVPFPRSVTDTHQLRQVLIEMGR